MRPLLLEQFITLKTFPFHVSGITGRSLSSVVGCFVGRDLPVQTNFSVIYGHIRVTFLSDDISLKPTPQPSSLPHFCIKHAEKQKTSIAQKHWQISFSNLKHFRLIANRIPLRWFPKIYVVRRIRVGRGNAVDVSVQIILPQSARRISGSKFTNL